MSNIRKIFLWILLGSFLVIIFFIAFLGVTKVMTTFSPISYFIYVGLMVLYILLFDGQKSLKKTIKTTNNDWTDEKHIEWIFNRMKHVHKDKEVINLTLPIDEINLEWAYVRLINLHKENKHYDYMIRLRKIIDKNGD